MPCLWARSSQKSLNRLISTNKGLQSDCVDKGTSFFYKSKIQPSKIDAPMEGTRYMKLQESFEKMFAQINVMDFLFSPFSLSSSPIHTKPQFIFLSSGTRKPPGTNQRAHTSTEWSKTFSIICTDLTSLYLSFLSVQAQMQLGNLWFLLSLASLTAWEKEVRRMHGVTGLTVIGSHSQNVCSIKEDVPGTEVSLHSTNCGISALAGTVLIVNQSVTASTASASTSFLLLPFLEW